MKREGELDPESLAELFTALSDQGASGVLSVTSPMGQKQIAFSTTEIAVLSDPLAERTRLGDLLVARNKLTEETLEQFLARQKASVPPPLLGDLLLKNGLLKKEDLDEALRFQAEEEIYDLFSWRQGTYTFDDERGAGDLEEAASSEGSQVLRAHLESAALLKGLPQKLDDWLPFVERIPTPYICFKMTAQGQENYQKATGSNRKLLKILRESRTLESAVKLSAMGRFAVYKAVTRYLDDAWLIPAPAAELRYLASELKGQGYFMDALFINRRLYETLAEDEEREVLERQMDELAAEVKKLRATDQRSEGGALARHRAALDAYRRRVLRRRVALVVLGLGGIGYTLYWWKSIELREPPHGVLLRKIEDTEKALAAGRSKEALELWDEFYKAFPNKDSPLAQQAKERLVWLTRSFDRQVVSQVAEAQLLESSGKDDEAEAAFLKLKQEYPDHQALEAVPAALDRIQKRRAERKQQVELGELRLAMSKARELEKGKLHERTREEFTRIAKSAPEGSDIAQEAKEGLARLETLANKVRGQLELADGHHKQNRAEKALEAFQGAFAEWPELPDCHRAAPRADALRQRSRALREAVVAARSLEDRGLLRDAAAAYAKVADDYPEFEEATALRTRTQGLDTALKASEDLLQKAQTALQAGRKDEARKLLAELLRDHRSLLVLRKFKLPATILSIPPDALVSRNGKELGRTPLKTELPVDEPSTFTFAKPGHLTVQHAIPAARVEDMEISVRLEREALRTLELPGPPLAPPALLGGRLYVSRGPSLLALEPGAAKTLWTAARLVDDSAGQRPNSDGSDVPVLVSDKSWWYLREPPRVLDDSQLLLPTRGRDVLSVPLDGGPAKSLVKLPVEPVGPVYYERSSLLAGKALLAAATAQGLVKVYDLAAPKAPKWEQPLDAAPYPRRAPIGGVFPSGSGSIACCSAAGTLTSFSLVEGQKRWTLELGKPVVAAVALSFDGRMGRELYAACITDQGSVVLVDLAQGRRIWEHVAERASLRAATLGATPQGILVHCTEGLLRHLPLRADGGLKPLWEATLDDQGVAPVYADGKVFAATRSGHVYTVHADDGRVLWRLRCPGVPTHLACGQNLLYVALEEGKLVVFNTE